MRELFNLAPGLVGVSLSGGSDFPACLAAFKEAIPYASRQWEPTSKVWLVRTHTAPVQSALAHFAARWGIASGETAGIRHPAIEDEEKIEASRAVDSMPQYAGSWDGKFSLHPYQHAGVAYALGAKRLLIGDEMGLGKTCQALVTARESGAAPILICCPKTLKLKWEREARQWLWKGAIVQRIDSSKTHPKKGADVYVVNYDILAPDKGPKGRYTKNLTGLAARLQAVKPQVLIADESHLLKNGSARRTKAMRLLAEGIEWRMLLTGTPVLNTPADLASQLAVIGRIGEFGGYSWFRDYYEEHTRAKDRDLLNRWLRSVCYLRREKKQGLPGLPEKERAIVEVSLSNWDEYSEIETGTRQWLKDNPDDRLNAGAKLEYLRQATARGKLEAAYAWIDNFLESGEQLVVFGWHREIVEAIAQRYGCSMIRGGVSAGLRDQAVSRFQAGQEKVIACNIQSGGVGIDLYAASNVLFIEYAWTPAEMEQAEDRCHRLGQKDNVTAWYLMAPGTIDERLLRLLESKRQMADVTIKGQSVMAELAKELRYA